MFYFDTIKGLINVFYHNTRYRLAFVIKEFNGGANVYFYKMKMWVFKFAQRNYIILATKAFKFIKETKQKTR